MVMQYYKIVKIAVFTKKKMTSKTKGAAKARSLVVSNLCSEIKGSQFQSFKRVEVVQWS